MIALARAVVRKLSTAQLVHLGLAVLWVLTLVPTLLWWRDSVLWVAAMSIYAIVVAHLSAFQAAGAEREAKS